MAANRNFGYATGKTLFAIVTDGTGKYANGTTLEAFNAADWTSYRVTIPEVAAGTGQYCLTFPALPAGDYHVEVYEAAGGTPATDTWAGISGDFAWDGSAFVTGDKAGYSLAETGLDAISVADPGAPAGHDTLAKMIVATWRALFRKNTQTATQWKRYADDGTTATATATLSDDGTTKTFGSFS